MKLSEQTISAIVRALLNDRKKIAEDIGFWHGRVQVGLSGAHHLHQMTADLKENAKALIDLADSIAPWLKQHADWQSIAQHAAERATA